MPRLRVSSQSLTEYALCLVMVTAAIMAMRMYVQRSISARYRTSVVSVLESTGAPVTQYEPYYHTSVQTSTAEQGVTTGGSTSSTVDVTTNHSGTRHIGPASGAD